MTIKAIVSHFPHTQHHSHGEPREVCLAIERMVRRLDREGQPYVVEVANNDDRIVEVARVRGYVFDLTKELNIDRGMIPSLRTALCNAPGLEILV